MNHELTKHTLIKLKETDCSSIKGFIDIPTELNQFWKQIGYVFFHNKNKYSFDRLLFPEDFKIINLREEFYEFDPDLEYYEIFPERVIFMEIVEGTYLTMDKKSINGKNSIYYFDELISDSLEEFIKKFDNEGHFFEKNE
ncbi:hypothetical protein IX49_08440 [Cellulophaga lytica]|nr:hypothetical protein IX49_08440 [Cellulophaga lytica]